MMNITYFHPLYGKEVTAIVRDKIEFQDGYVHFCSGGHGCLVDIENVRKIEVMDD